MYSRLRPPLQHPRRTLSASPQDSFGVWNDTNPGHHTEDGTQEGSDNEMYDTFTAPKQTFLSRYSTPMLFLLASVVMFAIIGGTAMVVLLSGSNTVTSRKIDVLLNGPRTLRSGDELVLQVSVHNNNNATLELADLLVTYPPGTREISDIGASLEAERISLGEIEPGGVRNGTIRSVLFGKNGETKEVSVELEYRLANSSGIFSTDPVTYRVPISSSALTISLDTHTQAVAGQRMDMTATITSNAQKIIRDVVVYPTFPFGFSVDTTSPPLHNDGLWELGDMEPGESREIRINGTLDGQSGDERTFRLIAGTRTTPQSRQVDTVLAEFEKRITVARPFLDMSLSFDGKEGDTYIATPGESVEVILSWRNNLPVGLSDVVIAATLGGTGFDPFRIDVDNGFYRSIDSLVLWDKATTDGELAQVSAGQEGMLRMRLTPKKGVQLAGVENPTITFELHAAGQRLSESRVPESLQASVKASVKVATDATFTSRGLYFDNPLGSVGPLPPKVHAETTYGIMWEVSNSTNSVENASVTAILPPYVRWIGSVSPAAEQVVFNENDRTVTWRLDKVLPNTGVGAIAPRRVVFGLGLIPSTSQIGKSPVLIQQQVFTGTDGFTDTFIRIPIDDVTTALHESRFADYYGLVTQ